MEMGTLWIVALALGALDRVRDRIRERNTRYAKWRRQQARAANVAAETVVPGAGAGVGHE